MRWGWVLLALSVAGEVMAYEEPAFEVVERTEAFELRRYAPLLVAETEVDANFDDAGNRAFRILAGYIGGDNRGRTEIAMTAPVNQEPAGEKIAMTAPVNQQPIGEEIAMTAPVNQQPIGEEIAMTTPVNQEPVGDGADARYRIQFVMPGKYTAATLPEPTDPRVTIREVPERWVAARRYSGTWSQRRYREQEAALLGAVAEAGLETIGPPTFARYNSPFSLWFLRRNEALVEVRPR